MEAKEFAEKFLKLFERLVKAVEKIAKDEPTEEQHSVKGFNPGGTD